MELFFLSEVRTATTNLVEKIRTMEHFVVILVWTFVFIVLRLFNSTQTTGEICSKLRILLLPQNWYSSTWTFVKWHKAEPHTCITWSVFWYPYYISTIPRHWWDLFSQDSTCGLYQFTRTSNMKLLQLQPFHIRFLHSSILLWNSVYHSSSSLPDLCLIWLI